MKSLIFAMILGAASVASADCECYCIDGEVASVCETAMDLEPVCSALICPPLPLEPEPIPDLVQVPVGATECRQHQVYDKFMDKYEWVMLCK